jgi:hypothetical protein
MFAHIALTLHEVQINISILSKLLLLQKLGTQFKIHFL